VEKLYDCKKQGVELDFIPLDLTIEEFLVCPVRRLKTMSDERKAVLGGPEKEKRTQGDGSVRRK
jgi:hypothetical protein